MVLMSAACRANLDRIFSRRAAATRCQPDAADVLTTCGYELIDAAQRMREHRSHQAHDRLVDTVETACADARAAVRGR